MGGRSAGWTVWASGPDCPIAPSATMLNENSIEEVAEVKVLVEHQIDETNKSPILNFTLQKVSNPVSTSASSILHDLLDTVYGYIQHVSYPTPISSRLERIFLINPQA